MQSCMDFLDLRWLYFTCTAGLDGWRDRVCYKVYIMRTHWIILAVEPYDSGNLFEKRALYLLEAAGIPLLRSLNSYTKRIATILDPSSSKVDPNLTNLKSLLDLWLKQSFKHLPPTWGKLLEVIRHLPLDDLAQQTESYLNSIPVDKTLDVGVFIDEFEDVKCHYGHR